MLIGIAKRVVAEYRGRKQGRPCSMPDCNRPRGHNGWHDYRFACGCTGEMPKRGFANMFATTDRHCRVSNILRASRASARMGGYRPIDASVPHWPIRLLMEEPNCWRCGQPLDWSDLRIGYTPHLHHNHLTGDVYGFTHPWCNAGWEKDMFDRLYATRFVRSLGEQDGK